MSTLEQINRVSNLRFLLYTTLSKRIAKAEGGRAVGPAPNINHMIRACDARLEELWKERRKERVGQAARIVEYWWGLPHGDIAPLAR